MNDKPKPLNDPAPGSPKLDQPPRGEATRAAVERGGNGPAPGSPKLDQPPRGEATRAAVERGGNGPAPGSPQARNPLHGLTLQAIVTALAEHYGWDELGHRIPIRCFNVDASVGSSLKFLRKTPWAREKVESLYLFMLREQRRKSGDALQ